jgi:hypothetical protein
MAQLYGKKRTDGKPKALECSDSGDLYLDIDGKILPTLTHVNIDFSSSAEQTIIAAPSAGNRVVVQSLELTALNNVEVAVKNGSTTIKTFVGVVIAPRPFNLSAASALKIQATTAERITGGVSYFTEAV